MRRKLSEKQENTLLYIQHLIDTLENDKELKYHFNDLERLVLINSLKIRYYIITGKEYE